MLRPLLSLLLCQASLAFSLSLDESRFLLTRTGFTPSMSEIVALSNDTRESAVISLLNKVEQAPLAMPQALQDLPPPPEKNAAKDVSDAYRKKLRSTGTDLQRWWYQQMLTTNSPFTEQLVLFWHNHFVSSLQKVKNPISMHQQQQLFREMALGNFKQLVQAISKDPAMTLYLDNQSNKKAAPNENYARELMELFTLGEGNYSETDIKEAARAFTGWQIDRRSGVFSVRANQHDTGNKTIFGKTGPWQGEQVVELIFSEKGDQVAQFISEKFWRALVSPNENELAITKLAKLFQESNYEIKPLLQALLTSDEFWAQMAQPNLIKSPVDLVIGTQRLLETEFNTRSMIRQMSIDMEQKLFFPPNVKGWPGGTEWISSTTLIARAQFLSQISREFASAEQDDTMNTRQLMKYSLPQWQSLILGHLPLTEPFTAQGNTDVKRYQQTLSALFKDPAYQLK